MINLVRKEFIIQKKNLLTLFGYAVFMLIAFTLSPGGMAQSAYIAAGVATTYMFIQYSCIIEDKSKSEIILNSLPVDRSKIVFSKYISAILFSLLATIFTGLLGGILAKLSFVHIENINMVEVVAILTGTWILASVYLPIYFKFGYIKAKLFNVMVFLFLFFVSLSFSSFIKLYFESPLIVSAVGSLSNQGFIVIGGIILLVTIIAVTLSTAISARIYSNREFN